MSTRTHCAHGHELTPENTYRSPAGKRSCRVCIRERRSQARKKQAPKPTFTPGTLCPAGHPYDEANPGPACTTCRDTRALEAYLAWRRTRKQKP